MMYCTYRMHDDGQSLLLLLLLLLFVFYDCEDDKDKDEEDEDEDVWATCEKRCLDLCIGSCISQMLHICEV